MSAMADVPDLMQRADEFLRANWSRKLGDISVALAELLDAVEREAIEQAAVMAEQFTVKDDASIYPDMPFRAMPRSTQTTAHTTAQQIARCIRALAEKATPS
jgi:hypothetical protein